MAHIFLPDEDIRSAIEHAYHTQWLVKRRVDNYGNGRKFVPQFTNAPRTFGVKRVGERMKAILLKHIRMGTVSSNGRSGLSDFPAAGIVVEYPPNSIAKNVLPAGVEVKIYFDQSVLGRESLFPEKYGGIDNIVSLFIHGYDAKKQVAGTWRGKRVASLAHRPSANNIAFYPNGNFMKNAIEEFNREFRGYAKAHINDSEYDI